MQREKTAVIYHASCPDGFGAAWAAHRVLGAQAQYLPMNHGDPIPQMDDDTRVYILDFSFDRERMVDLHSKHGQDNVILLDHHITAQQELSGLPNCHIDLSKSGAVLSWEHFHVGSAAPTLLLYVQDKDLWTWELPDSRAITAYLTSCEMDFDTWDRVSRDFETAEGFRNAVEAGEAVLRSREQAVREIGQLAQVRQVGGHRIPVANSPIMQSEIGEYLLNAHPDAPFAAIYFDVSPTVRKWSLRSRNDRFDVSELAKQFGGGGHPAASGFSQSIQTEPPAVPAEPTPGHAGAGD
ncbi:MAG: DHHA1 domain-containing protein [Chloroflexi bacterium]|nr:DHHA1 domain-containing protein [Chloroflexota bacterium]